MICELVGGLGIFLLGMKNMSEGMQAVAGKSLRRMIALVTNNRLFAVTVGVLVTCIVQSSSVTTVMVVGFVNSGVMGLAQAIGVIMGANIGTTITGWILVLKVGKYGLPLMGAAAFVFLFSRRELWRYWAMALMGVGMVFFGLEIMKDACKIIKDMPEFAAWFQAFTADTYWGVLKCAFVGCLLTTLVQSSSATLGITISLATEGVIGYETAAALVLGENIGTTITAFLASLGATTNARRAAYFHVIFNIIGVLWITAIFQWYVRFIPWLVEGSFIQGSFLEGTFVDSWFLGDDVGKAVVEVDPDTGREATTYPNTTAAIAATHTVFNIVNTLMFFPFAGLFVTFLNRIVPGKDFKEKPRLTDLDIRMLETPLLAIDQSGKEIQRMGASCEKMLVWLADLMQQDEPDAALGDRLKRREQVLDSIHDEIAVFVTNLVSGSVPHSVADEARLQLRMADEFESISDYIVNLNRFDRKLRRDGMRYSQQQRSEMLQLNKHAGEYLAEINLALKAKNKNIAVKSDPVSKRIKSEIKKLRREHLDDLSNGEIAPQVSVAFLAALNAYDRVRDHSQNIAESISGEK
ncbi:MAG: Na/Pi cotransporter family protein [Pirellulaceae bacterium]